MKKIQSKIIIVIVSALTSTIAFAQSSTSNKAILDSLEVLKTVGGFVDGYTYPPTTEETRYHNIAKMLFSLPFSETKKLLKDKNKFARCYGFSVSAKMYFDSLTNADLEIFMDTSSLPLYTQSGNIDAGLTLGQYCEMAYTSAIEEKKIEAKQPDIIAAVKSFIKSNAKYPSSYEPLDFKDYSWWGESDNDITYEIKHLYKIKQSDGKSVSVQEYFILDKDFKIILIEKNRSNIFKADPPKTDEWLKTYSNNCP